MTLPREVPLAFGRPQIGEEEIAEVVDTLRSGWITTGPRVARFEKEFAERAGTEHAVALASCTAALHLSLLAAGVGPGDEVVTSPTTYCATAHAIVHAGATPVFADVEPDTGNIDPDAIEAAITSRTAALIPVHLGGRPCRMDRIGEIAGRHGLLLVEDAAHAVGASIAGRPAGSLGDAACFSFYATKNVATGEGGMLVTDDAELAGKVRTYAHHGLVESAWQRSSPSGYRHPEAVLPGFKAGMTDIQAALGIHQLRRLDRELSGREELSRRYDEGLDGLAVERPAPAGDGVGHARHLYSVLVETEAAGKTRDEALGELFGLGIGGGVHFKPVHLQPYYRETYGHREGEFPVAEHIGERTLSLPFRATLEDEDVADVVAAMARVVGTPAPAVAG